MGSRNVINAVGSRLSFAYTFIQPPMIRLHLERSVRKGPIYNNIGVVKFPAHYTRLLQRKSPQLNEKFADEQPGEC